MAEMASDTSNSSSASGASSFKKFEEAAKRIFSVPKKDLDKAELRKRKEKEAREADRSK